MPDPNDEQFVQQRLLLACVLSALAIAGYVYVNNLLSPPPPETAVSEPMPGEQTPSDSPAAGQPAKEPSAAPAAAPPARPEPAAAAYAPNRKVAEREQEITVETDTYLITFSNRGGTVTSWVLKEYISAKEGEPLPLDLVRHADKMPRAFTLAAPGGEAMAALNDALFTVDGGFAHRTGTTAVTFTYDDGQQAATKTFRFESEGYLLEIESSVSVGGVPQNHLLQWDGGFGDLDQPFDSQHTTTFYYDTATRSLTRNTAADAADDRAINTGSFPYAGIDDLFFTAVFLPLESGGEVRMETGAIPVLTPEESEEPFATLAVGGSPTNRFQVFLGPKSFQLMGSVRPEMRDIVAFGDWFGILAKPLYWMLIWAHGTVVANYGWAIIVVTLIINIALFPLKWKGSGSMKKMQALQPLVKQINDKYKGLGMRDPKKQKQQEEMMALYKKHGVNPMGGCLPMVIQLPFFIAFYSVLTVAIEIRQSEWLWVGDLSQPEQITIRVLPLAMIASQFWMQSLTPTPGGDPTQMRLMKFMPLMFGVLFWGFSSGLVLYWLTSNLVGVLQQVILNRMPSEPLEIEQPKRRKNKKKSG